MSARRVPREVVERYYPHLWALPRPDGPRCSCDPGPNGEHHDYCETNHPNHPCDDRSCRFAPDSGGGQS